MITRKLGSMFSSKCAVKHEGACFLKWTLRPRNFSSPAKAMDAPKFDPTRKFSRTRKMMFMREPARPEITESVPKRRKIEQNPVSPVPHPSNKLMSSNTRNILPRPHQIPKRSPQHNYLQHQPIKERHQRRPPVNIFPQHPPNQLPVIQRHPEDHLLPPGSPAMLSGLTPGMGGVVLNRAPPPRPMTQPSIHPTPMPTPRNYVQPVIPTNHSPRFSGGYPPITGTDRNKEVWRGHLTATPVPSFHARFLLIGGYKMDHIPLQGELKMNGRIHFKNLNTFLPQITSSSRKNVTFCEVHPVSVADHQAYNQFCNHYKDLERGAVYDQTRTLGWQVYIIPADEEGVDTSVFVKAFCTPPTQGIMTCLVIRYTDWKPEGGPQRVRVRTNKASADPRRRPVANIKPEPAPANTQMSAMNNREKSKQFGLFAAQTDPTKG